MRKIYPKVWKALARKQSARAIVEMKDNAYILSTSPRDCTVCGYMLARGVILISTDRGMACDCPAQNLCRKFVNIVSNYNSGKWKTFLCIRRMQEHIKELKS